jgi:UDP-2,4-diacetamido-2,4,6-trideoxy-beta-L-altropyranose hydrolase
MNVFFRVDSDRTIGAGHLARCSYLAKFLELKSPFAVFFISKNKDHVRHKFIDIKNQHFIDYVDTQSDAEETIKLLREYTSPKTLIIDSYLHDEKWERLIRPHVDLLIVIDDLANRKHECDILIDCGYQRLKTDYSDKVDVSTKLLLGLDYCFISQDIQDIENQSKNPTKIHLYFGSTISNDLVLKYFVLLKKYLPEYCYNVALTMGLDARQEEVWSAHKGVDDLSFSERPLVESLSTCSYAIGAPGVATWERSFLEIPGMYIAVNENQVNIIKDLEKLDFCRLIGSIRNEAASNVLLIKELLDSGEIQKLKNKLSGKIDGQGFFRVLELIKEYDK